MSRAPDKDVHDTEASPASEPAGKVEFDSRGNSVWRWARDVLESTSVLLKRLDNKDLALEPIQKVPVVRSTEQPPKKKGGKPRVDAETTPADAKAAHPAMQRERRRDGSGGGFDPYNSR
jgi:hypothetical protein